MTHDAQPLLKQLADLDSQFMYQEPPPSGTPWFDIVTGRNPVLVSAPHACSHLRDGDYKMHEEYTGAIALHLAQVCNCYAVVARYQATEDPNWDNESHYKSAVESLVKDNNIGFLIDLHGMTNRYNMGVALGTINSSACDPAIVVPHFIDAGFKSVPADELHKKARDSWRQMVVDHPKFTGGVVNNTVTRFAAQQLRISAVQIELASEVRVVKSVATADWPSEYIGRAQAIVASCKALQSLVMSQVF